MNSPRDGDGDCLFYTRIMHFSNLKVGPGGGMCRMCYKYGMEGVYP